MIASGWLACRCITTRFAQSAHPHNMVIPTWGLLRTAVLGVIVAMVGYRLRTERFNKSVLTGAAGQFEDTINASGER